MLPADSKNVLNKVKGNEHIFISFERALGETLKPFMAEVYLVNAGVLAYYIHSQREANVGDIVASSAEGLNRPGLLRYAKQAAVHFDWNSALAITLRMEFVHESLTTVFDVVFNSDFVGVDILVISYREGPAGQEDGYERFTRAIADLRRLDS